MDRLELIADLSNALGAPGFEEEIGRVLSQHTDLALETDRMKNIYLGLEEEENLVLLDAHSDEVGFMVRYIDDDGLLGFLPLGGWVDYTVAAQAVLVRGKNGYHQGIVTTKPIHFMTAEERQALPTIETMRIDLGGYRREEVVEDLGIGVGAPVLPHVRFSYDAKKQVMRGKAFDNRLGTAAVLCVLEELEKRGTRAGVVGAIAAQEEVGSRGARLTARRVQPKYSIIFEGSPSDDAFVAPYRQQCRMGGGPQIRHYDGSYIASEFMISLAEKVGRDQGIPLQHAVRQGSATNAGAIHLENQGIPCLVLGIPSRYIHTPYSYASFEDFQAAVRLAVGVVEELQKISYEAGLGQ